MTAVPTGSHQYLGNKGDSVLIQIWWQGHSNSEKDSPGCSMCQWFNSLHRWQKPAVLDLNEMAKMISSKIHGLPRRKLKQKRGAGSASRAWHPVQWKEDGHWCQRDGDLNPASVTCIFNYPGQVVQHSWVSIFTFVKWGCSATQDESVLPTEDFCLIYVGTSHFRRRNWIFLISPESLPSVDLT